MLQSTSIENLCNETKTKQQQQQQTPKPIQSQLKIGIKPFTARSMCVVSSGLSGHSRAMRSRIHTSKDTNESAYNLQSVLFYVIDITNDDSFNLLFFFFFVFLPLDFFSFSRCAPTLCMPLICSFWGLHIFLVPMVKQILPFFSYSLSACVISLPLV